MIKNTLLAAALVALPSIASAVTVTAVNDYTSALSNVVAADSLDLPGTWTDAPFIVNPDASLGGVYRSPYETSGLTAAGYFSVGTSSTYSATSNPAVLALDNLSKSVSLLWGSPDSYNTLELFNGSTLIATIFGNQFNIPAREASFVTIAADGAGEFFDTLRFSSGSNAFEFSNVTATPVPLPASGLFLIAGVGALMLRKARKQS